MKKICLLGSCLLSLSLFFGCSNHDNLNTIDNTKSTNSSQITESTTLNTTSFKEKIENKSEPMNLEKITQFDYEHLSGEWRQVAKSKNGDMEDNWTIDDLNDTLTVKGNKISAKIHFDENTTPIILEGDSLTFRNEIYKVVFQKREGRDEQLRTASDSNTVDLSFNPKNNVIKYGGWGLTPNTVNPLKETISVHWTENYGSDDSKESFGYTALFQRENISPEDINKEEVARDIISTEDVQKYIDAYNEFSMKGNPMPPEQRGSAPLSDEFLEEVGLSAEKYYEIMWGVYDYYGNAYNQGLVTEDLNNFGISQAHKKLKEGYYGSNSDKTAQYVTKDHVLDYVNKYVKETTGWELEYPEVEIIDTEYYKVYFYAKDPSLTQIAGYFKVTTEGMVSRYSNMGSRLTVPEQVNLP